MRAVAWVIVFLVLLAGCTNGVEPVPYMECYVDTGAGVFYCVIEGDTITGGLR